MGEIRRDHITLRAFSELYYDTQQFRISVENRIRALTMDADPVPPELAERLEAVGLEYDPVPPALTDHLELMQHAERITALAMRQTFRAVEPDIYRWTKNTTGLGEHLMARLIGAIGNPVHAQPYTWMDDEEAPKDPDLHVCGSHCGKGRHLVALEPFDRTPSQLLQYCGHGDPAEKRRKGMSQDDAMRDGKPLAKMLVHLIAESCMKNPGTGSAGGALLPDEPKPQTTAKARSAVGDPSTTTEPVPAATATDRSAGGGHLLLDEPTDVATATVVAVVEEPATGDGSVPEAPARDVPVRRRSPYRDAYDLARTKYADREDWTLGHQHNAALRYVGKQILIDLWRVSSGLPPRWKSEDGL